MTFDFSLLPRFHLEEEGATLLECPTGPKELSVEVVNGRLLVGGQAIFPYVPSRQVSYPDAVDVGSLLDEVLGLSLALPMLAQVLYDHPELIPITLGYYFELQEGSGVIFPNVKIKTWTGKVATVSLVTIHGKPHFNSVLMDRLPRRKSYLLQVPLRS